MDKRSFIAFEIGSSAVKQIRAAFDGKTLFWSGAQLVELRERDETAKKRERLGAIGELLKRQGGSQDGERILIINSIQSFFRELFLPRIPRSEIEQATQLQLKKEAPFSGEEVRIGYQVSEVKRPGEGDRLHVLAAATSQKVLDDYQDSFKQLGWQAEEILHTPFTIGTLAESVGILSGEIVALIDVGASMTELNIYQDFEMKFARKIKLGGGDITEAMVGPAAAERMGLPSSFGHEEAEKLMRTRGILAEHPSDANLPGFERMQFLSLVRPVLERLQTEIVRSFNYFSEQSRGRQVQRVYLTGGGALTQGLVEFLQKRLQTPVSVLVLRPCEGLQWSGDLPTKESGLTRYHRLLFTLASKLEEKPFVPSFAGFPLKRWIEGAVVLGFVILFLTGAKFFGLNYQADKMEGRWKEVMSVPFETAKQLKSLENEVIERRSRLNQFFVAEPYWEEAFRELTNILPANFLLDSIDYETSRLTLRGNYWSAVGEEESLSGFLTALSKGVFRSAKLVSTRETDKKSGTFSFEISCKI